MVEQKQQIKEKQLSLGKREEDVTQAVMKDFDAEMEARDETEIKRRNQKIKRKKNKKNMKNRE